MKIVDRISMVLRQKGCEIISIPPDASVYSAVELMADREVGSLLVIDQGHLVGLISERDYSRKIILKGRSSKDTFVREIMVENPQTVCPDCSIDDAMRMMTSTKTRHLPVVDTNDHVCGVVSIGDLVNWIVTSQDEAIAHLEHYIAGDYCC
jgi:CBS domain-containing protein